MWRPRLSLIVELGVPCNLTISLINILPKRSARNACEAGQPQHSQQNSKMEKIELQPRLNSLSAGPYAPSHHGRLPRKPEPRFGPLSRNSGFYHLRLLRSALIIPISL